MNMEELASSAAQAESFLKALGNSRRLMILCELHKGERSVTELQRALGLGQSSMSQHLGRLREDDLVATRRDARTIYYSLASEKVTRTIGLLYELFCAAQCGVESPPAKEVKSKKKAGASGAAGAKGRGTK